MRAAGYSPATFYRRRREYEQRGTLSALVPTKSKVTRKRRTSDEVEAIIQSEIKSLQKKGVTCISDIHNSIEGAIYGEDLKKTEADKQHYPRKASGGRCPLWWTNRTPHRNRHASGKTIAWTYQICLDGRDT